MTQIIDPLLQAKALKELARKLPMDSRASSTIYWENGHGSTGVTVSSVGKCTVFLFEAEQEMETLSDAGELLKSIFADKMAAVAAYANEQFVFGGLVQTNDPESGFDMLSSPELRAQIVPEFDHVLIATWSRGVHEEAK